MGSSSISTPRCCCGSPSATSRRRSRSARSRRHARIYATPAVVAGSPIALVDVGDTTVTSAAGQLRARMYTPEEALAERDGPLVLYFHDGGGVCGDLDTHDQTCRALARSSGARRAHVLAVASEGRSQGVRRHARSLDDRLSPPAGGWQID
jgi:hypothetical protein